MHVYVNHRSMFLCVDGDISRIRPGDCLVAFSRNSIFSLKAKVEQYQRSHCAVVYGGLPSGKGMTDY